MTKHTKMSYMAKAIVVLGAGIGSLLPAHAANVTITIKTGADAAHPCTADKPWKEIKKTDTVIWTANSPGTYQVKFKQNATPFANTDVDNITSDPNNKVKTPVTLNPSATCQATANTCYLPYEILLNGARCNGGDPPFNSDGIIVKP